MAEEARFENPEALETIGAGLTSSFRSQSLTEESGVRDEPIKHDRTRWFCHSLATAAPEEGWVKNSKSDLLVPPRF
jgi:hypothetical protein